MLNDESIMEFGLHKGKMLVDIPDDYLLYMYGQLCKSCTRKTQFQVSLVEYIKENMDAIKLNVLNDNRRKINSSR